MFSWVRSRSDRTRGAGASGQPGGDHGGHPTDGQHLDGGARLDRRLRHAPDNARGLVLGDRVPALAAAGPASPRAPSLPMPVSTTATPGSAAWAATLSKNTSTLGRKKTSRGSDRVCEPAPRRHHEVVVGARQEHVAGPRLTALARPPGRPGPCGRPARWPGPGRRQRRRAARSPPPRSSRGAGAASRSQRALGPPSGGAHHQQPRRRGGGRGRAAAAGRRPAPRPAWRSCRSSRPAARPRSPPRPAPRAGVSTASRAPWPMAS